ncbi:MAG: hypothetical protein ACK5MG_03370 [Bacteroidales bacterium]
MTNNPQIIVGGAWNDISATESILNNDNIKLDIISAEESESYLMAFEMIQQHSDDADEFVKVDTDNLKCIKISCADNTLNACIELMASCSEILKGGGEITLLPLSMNMLTKNQWLEIMDEEGDEIDKAIDVFTDIVADEDNEELLISAGMQSFGLKDYFIDGFDDFEDTAANLDSICRFVVGEGVDIEVQESISVGEDNESVYMATEPSAEIEKEDGINNQYGYIELMKITDE